MIGWTGKNRGKLFGSASLAIFLLGTPPGSALAWSRDEPEPICTRTEIIEFVAQEIHRRSPYAVMQVKTIGEQPGRSPSNVQCAVSVVQRDFDYVKYRTQTWTETQAFSVRWLDPGYEVTLRDPIRE